MADLNKCLEALRSLARSDDRSKLVEAELEINDLFKPISSRPDELRAALQELDNAVIQEAEQNPQDAEFWKSVRGIIATRLSGDDPQSRIWIMTQAEMEAELSRLAEQVSALQQRLDN